ncbi:hypothetical protein BH24PSE2_BH24PSE2_19950 [soil metagenome]
MLRRTRGATLLTGLGLFAISGCGDRAAPVEGAEAVAAPATPRVMPAPEALAGAHVPTIDPTTMSAAEIDKVLGRGPRCTFQYTDRDKPVLAASASRNDSGPAPGVVKLNGNLVPLRSAEPGSQALLQGPAMVADGVLLKVTPLADTAVENNDGRRRWEANLRFELDRGLLVHYRGFYLCDASKSGFMNNPG